MKEVNLKLKFLTPAFISGVDNRNYAEFRLPEFKGLLRFWWRAFCVDPKDTKIVFKKEKEIFGSTENRSPFLLRLEEPLRNYIYHNRTPFNYNQPGIKYLFYSMYQRGENFSGRSGWIFENREIPLRIIFFKEEVIPDVLKALWLLENFGGIGARCRRGAGSFKITQISGIEVNSGVPEFMCQWKTHGNNLSEEIKNFITEGLEKIDPPGKNLPNYTAYNRDNFLCKVCVGNDFNSWEEAADWIGQELQKFRTHRRLNNIPAPFNNEARGLHSFAQTGRYTGPDPITKTAFGLPIIYNFERASLRVKASFELTGGEEGRRASPLFIKIGSIRNKYYILVSLIWSKFLPDNQEIKIEVLKGRGRGGTHQLSQPQKDAIVYFIDSLPEVKI